MTEAERLAKLSLIQELEQWICKLPDGCNDPNCQEIVNQIAMLNGELND